ncbi:MAG: hypothetical protein U0893_24930 [Chloroflexota bacterium]
MKNELATDIAFKLRDADGARGTRAFVYVRAGEETVLEGVAPGSYLFQAAIGSDWDGEAHIFRRVVQVMQADNEVTLSEQATDEGTTWTTYTMRLFTTGGERNLGVPIDVREFLRD